MGPPTPRDLRAAWAPAFLALALVGGPGTADTGAGLERLVSQGRYAEAYVEASAGCSQVGDSLYLAALSAYNSLMLDDARRDLARLRHLGYERRDRGWPTVSDMSARLAAAERWTAASAPLGAPGARAGYDRFSSAEAAFATEIERSAPEAYGAACRIAFGSPRPPDPTPPIALYLFDHNTDAAEFLSALALHARTDGSGASIGLGIMLWRDLGGSVAHPGPYGLRATLAHETLHGFQSLIGAEYGPRWTVEGTALMAECLVDPNRALELRCKALLALGAGRDRVLAAMKPGSERFEDYPVYFVLCSYLARENSLASLGALMRDLNRYGGPSTEEALWRRFALTPAALATDVVRDAERGGPEWTAARDLVALRGRADAPGAEPTDGLLAAYRAHPDEPYLGYLAARALVRAGRLAEARTLVARLARTGYEGAAGGTLADLQGQLDGTGPGS